MSSQNRVPFPLLAELPVELHDVILDFHWDLARLHRLALPTQDVRCAELAWQLQLPFWAIDGQPFRITPAEVAAAPGRYPQQWQRTVACDLSYPLDGYRRSDGRIIILDGVHRLLKATMLERPTSGIRLLEVDDFDKIAVPLED